MFFKKIIFLSGMFIMGCGNCPDIKGDDFSQKTIEGTFGKMKASIECEETEWAWETLSQKTRNQLSYLEFAAGWKTYSQERKQIKKAQIIKTESYDYDNREAEKVTIKSGEKEESFLFVKERNLWYLEFPSPWENSFSFMKPNSNL